MSIKVTLCSKILKAFQAYERSLSKVSVLSSDPVILTDDEEEHWEAYCSRFVRLQDMIVKRFFRFLATEDDPAWSGSVRDLLNLMEKKAVIESSHEWLLLRELRNEMAHEYEDSALQALFERARDAAPIMLAVKVKVSEYETS